MADNVKASIPQSALEALHSFDGEIVSPFKVKKDGLLVNYGDDTSKLGADLSNDAVLVATEKAKLQPRISATGKENGAAKSLAKILSPSNTVKLLTARGFVSAK